MKQHFLVLLLGAVLVGVIFALGWYMYLDRVLLESQNAEDYFISEEGIFDKINQTEWEVADLCGYYLTSYRWRGGRCFLIAASNQMQRPMLLPIFVEGKGWNEELILPPFIDLQTGSRIEDDRQLRQVVRLGEKLQVVLLVFAPGYSGEEGMSSGVRICNDNESVHQRLCAVARITANWDNQIKDWYLDSVVTIYLTIELST